MNAYKTIGERAALTTGRKLYVPGVGFTYILHCEILWANIVRYTVTTRDGRIFCPLQQYYV